MFCFYFYLLSDGWDRTPQLVSLAQLFLDPYYRTIKGFCALIEKDWIEYGHMFQQRGGFGLLFKTTVASNEQEYECSPSFLTFLDCVWQTMFQFPSAFEYNESLLVYLYDAFTDLAFGISSLFIYLLLYFVNIKNYLFIYFIDYNFVILMFLGTFLYDKHYERLRHHLDKRSPSVWSAILLQRNRFINKLYQHEEREIIPSFSMGELQFWINLYLRSRTKRK